MVAPYITPQMLIESPTGVDWSHIAGPNTQAQVQLAAQLRICQQATADVESICNQPLKATVNTEVRNGPDFWITVGPGGVARYFVTRWPILQLVSAKVSVARTFPPQWQVIEPDQLEIETGDLGLEGSTAIGSAGDGPAALLIAPGHITWAYGRNGYRLQVVYINGWPHTQVNELASAGDSTLEVDDITAWIGARGTLYDGGNTEDIEVTDAVADDLALVPPKGPGTLVLASPLIYRHEVGVLCTTMPANIQTAATLLAVNRALMRGPTQLVSQRLAGVQAGGGSQSLAGVRKPEDLRKEAELILQPYSRVL